MCGHHGDRRRYTVFMPNPAEAAKTPSVEALALKEATAACKAEAKEKKIADGL
jgi:hypothetical protein